MATCLIFLMNKQESPSFMIVNVMKCCPNPEQSTAQNPRRLAIDAVEIASSVNKLRCPAAPPQIMDELYQSTAQPFSSRNSSHACLNARFVRSSEGCSDSLVKGSMG